MYRTWCAPSAASALAVVALTVALSSCGLEDVPPDPVASPSAPGPAPTASGGASPQVPPDGTISAPGDPTELVGLWVSEAEEGETAEIVYRFDADNTYAMVGLLWQERRNGIFKYQVTATGTYAVDHGTLFLSPLEGETTIDDPDAPESSGTRPREDLEAEVYTLALATDGRSLTLTDQDGDAIVYLRQAS